MGSRLVHPLCRVWISDEVEQPAEKCEPVTPSETETSGERSEGVGERARIVVDASDGVGYHIGHCLGVLVVFQKI